MNEMHIECGVQDNEPTSKDSSFIFLPLFKAIPIDSIWNSIHDQKFSLIFTSKTAVKIFASSMPDYFNDSKNLKYLESISCVGKATALLAESLFPKVPFFYPKKGVGLENLLLEEAEESIFSHASNIFIFTALNGKTSEIIQNLKNTKNLKFKIIPLYRLEPLPIDFDSLFAVPNFKFVFHCKSGQMLNQIVTNLMTYFCVKTANQLPSFIYFHTWENSATCKLIDLNLIDRKIS